MENLFAPSNFTSPSGDAKTIFPLSARINAFNGSWATDKPTIAAAAKIRLNIFLHAQKWRKRKKEREKKAICIRIIRLDQYFKRRHSTSETMQFGGSANETDWKLCCTFYLASYFRKEQEPLPFSTVAQLSALDAALQASKETFAFYEIDRLIHPLRNDTKNTNPQCIPRVSMYRQHPLQNVPVLTNTKNKVKSFSNFSALGSNLHNSRFSYLKNIPRSTPS